MVTWAARGPLSRLDELYQRHAGQECYLFGNGVSLKWMDLRRFADRPSIAGALLLYHREARFLNVPYCCFTEPLAFYPFVQHPAGHFGLSRNRLHHGFARSMKAWPKTLFLLNVSNYPVVRDSNVLFISRWYVPPFANRNPFRDRQDAHAGTLSFQLSLAIYLGFRKAYLVGHDYTHSPARIRHFYEKGEGESAGYLEDNKDIIEYAKEDIDLVTVTLDGASRLMDSITYAELTGHAPAFRENTDIVDRDYLENLATWPGYTIF